VEKDLPKYLEIELEELFNQKLKVWISTYIQSSIGVFLFSKIIGAALMWMADRSRLLKFENQLIIGISTLLNTYQKILKVIF